MSYGIRSAQGYVRKYTASLERNPLSLAKSCRKIIAVSLSFQLAVGPLTSLAAERQPDEPESDAIAEATIDAPSDREDSPVELSTARSARGYSRDDATVSPRQQASDGSQVESDGSQVESNEEAPESSSEPSPELNRLFRGDGPRNQVKGQVISVPKGAGKIEGMGESFSEQLSTGGAQYSVPFALLPARGAAQPSLALGYSSLSGSGLAGIGWGIGVPAITRQSDKGLPQYDDRNEWHPNQDHFVFNGGQELVPLCVVTSSLACEGALTGEVLPSWSAGWQYFRPRVEGSFQRFFWSPDHKTWRVQDKSGVSMELGMPLDGSADENGLVVNPDDHRELFQWMLVRQYDTYGDINGSTNVVPHNVVRYRYQHDGGAAYLSDIFDTTPAADPASSDLATYAHHTRVRWEARRDRRSSYRSGWRIDTNLRLQGVDVTSKVFGAGATSNRELVRRYHLAYDTNYHQSQLRGVAVEGRCPSPVYESADQLLADGTQCPRLPPLAFDYTHVEGRDDKGGAVSQSVLGFEPYDARTRVLAGSPPVSIDAAEVTFLDVDGDALEDILVTDPAKFQSDHGVYYNSSDGGLGVFSAGKIGLSPVLGANSSTIRLSNLNVVALDVDGDAYVDLLHMPATSTYGVYASRRQGSSRTWEGREVITPDGLDPRVDFAKDRSEITSLDVNFDGLVDVVRSAGTELQVFLSLGRYPSGDGRFGQASLQAWDQAVLSSDPIATCVPWAGDPVRFSDKEITTSDMNGDGMGDIVRLRQGSVVYWPGRGNGYWGTGSRSGCDAGQFGDGRHVEMSSSPYFSDFEQSNTQLSDVNADGFPDLVQVRFDGVDIWLNVNGESWSEKYTLSNTPEAPSFQSRTRLMDIDGSGTEDVVYGDSGNYRYLDLLGGRQPGLLTRVSNGLGKVTEIEYTTSTAEMLAAKQANSPWTSTMPIVATLVKRVAEYTELTIGGAAPEPLVTEYTYRDPRFEGRQREFRGFRRAEARKFGDANSPTSISTTEFLLGECQDETSSNGLDDCSLPERWRDNPREALKGLPTLTEVRDDEGNYLSTTHTGYSLRRLYRGLDGRDVRWAFSDETNSYLYDNGPFAPAVAATSIELEAARVEYATGGAAPASTNEVSRFGLRSNEFVHVKSRVVADNFGNTTEQRAHGIVGGTRPIDETIVKHNVPGLPQGDVSGWLWRTVNAYTTGDHRANGVRFGEQVLTYNEHGQPVQAAAPLQGTVPLDRKVAANGVVESQLSMDGTTPVVLSTTTYNSLGQPEATYGTGFRESHVTYDADYGDVAISERIHTAGAGAGGVSQGQASGGSDRVLEANVLEFDRGLGLPLLVENLHGEVTRTEFDEFGRVTASYAPSVTPGSGHSTLATAAIEYRLPDSTGRPFSIIRTQAQDGANENSADYSEAYAYVDGFGRTFAVLTEAEDGRWIVSGLQEWDAKGQPRRSYLPHFYSGSPDAFDPSEPPSVGYGRQRYDAFGREIQKYDVDGTVTLRSVHHAVSTDLWDAADLSPGVHQGTFATSFKDGHGRSVESVERFHSGAVIQRRHTLNALTPLGSPEVITRRLNDDNEGAVTRWMAYDSWGRRVLNVEPNTSPNYVRPTSLPNYDFDHASRAASLKAWRYAYNNASDLLGTSDARGCGENFLVDGVGRIEGEDYFPCETHHAPYTAPSRPSAGAPWNGVEVLIEYDVLTTNLGTESPQCQPNASTAWGRVVRVRDRASDNIARVDGRGQTTCQARRVLKPSSTTPLVDPDDDEFFGTPVTFADFASHWYERDAEYDAAGRTVRASTGAEVLLGAGAQSDVFTHYTSRGTVDRVTSSYQIGSSSNASHLISSIARSADGLIENIAWGDLASTTTHYSYDERRRVRTVQTYRSLSSWQEREDEDADFRHQRVLQDDAFEYDVVGNPIEVRDYRIAQEWPVGAKPVNKRMEYDDLYRMSRVEYDYAAGDAWSAEGEPGIGGPAPGGIPGTPGGVQPPAECEYPGNLSTLGFEHASAWTITNGSLALQDSTTQGKHKLAVTIGNQNTTVLTSQRLSSLGPNPNQLNFVIKLPNSLPQYDEASIQVYLNSPTVQLYNSWVAYDRFEVGLGGSTVQATYALTTEQRTKLASAPYEDLQIRIEFHSPQSGTYIFDGYAGLPLPDPSKGECGLSPAELQARDSDLLRFEKPQDWTVETRVAVPATQVAEGTNALAVSGYGYSRIISRRASGYAINGNTINLQLRVPSGSGWAGQLEVLLSTDSGSLNNHSLGRVELTPLTRNAFNNVSFALTSTAQTVVQNTALRDLRVILVLNSYLSGVFTIDGVAATPASSVASSASSGSVPAPDGLPSGSSSSSSGSGVGTGTNNTATNDLRAVLGFESLGTWRTAVYGAPQFQVAASHVQGNGALALEATGSNQVLTSQVVSTPEPLTGNLKFQVFIPSQQPTTRTGTGVSASLSCPSRGLWWGAWLGYQSLNNAAPGQWTTLSFPLTNVQNALSTGCTDLQLTLVFTSRPGGAYLFDGAAGLAPPTGDSNSETIPYEGTPVVAEARDAWVSPGAWEEEGNSKDNRVAEPGPRVRYAKRILWQTYGYDWLGNTDDSDDDEHGFYDRSLGTVENGGATEASNVPQGPYQLTRANNLGQSDMDGSLQTAYDETGNLTDLYVDRNGDCTSSICAHRYHYQWDEVGRMVSARRFDGNHDLGTDTRELALMSQSGALSPGAHLEFAYDSGDLRVRKTSVSEGLHSLYIFDSLELRQTEWYTGSNGVSKYVHHQLTEVPYLFANGVRLARVAYVPNQSTPEIPFTGAEPTPISGGQLSVLFTLGDHLGSTSVVLDKATSELVEKTTYQAYGTTESDYRPASWKGFRADYRFTGKEEDVEVGLVYFPKRYLNTYLQRWVSADPLEVHAPGEADANLYAYVHGEVLIALDLDGLEIYRLTKARVTELAKAHRSASNERAVAKWFEDAAIRAMPDQSPGANRKWRSKEREIITRGKFQSVEPDGVGRTVGVATVPGPVPLRPASAVTATVVPAQNDRSGTEVKLYREGRRLSAVSNRSQIIGYLDYLRTTHRSGDPLPSLSIVTLPGVKVANMEKLAQDYQVNIRVYRAMEDYDHATGTSKVWLRLDRVHVPGADVTVGSHTVSFDKGGKDPTIAYNKHPTYTPSAWTAAPQSSRISAPNMRDKE